MEMQTGGLVPYDFIINRQYPDYNFMFGYDLSNFQKFIKIIEELSMSNNGKIYGRQLSDSESDCLNYHEGVSPKELEETYKMLMDKINFKHLSAHSPKEIAAALEKVKNICPFCHSELEYLITFTNGEGIRIIYSCNLCDKLIFEDKEEPK